MHRDRLFRLVCLDTDETIGHFASVAECHARVRRHGLSAWAVWCGESLIESVDPYADMETPSAGVLLGVCRTLAVSR